MLEALKGTTLERKKPKALSKRKSASLTSFLEAKKKHGSGPRLGHRQRGGVGKILSTGKQERKLSQVGKVRHRVARQQKRALKKVS